MRKTQENIEGNALCRHCGKPYVKTSPLSRFCSEQCRKSHRRDYNTRYVSTRRAAIRAGKDTQPEKICVVCGRSFRPRCSNQLVCGGQCRSMHRKELMSHAYMKRRQTPAFIASQAMRNYSDIDYLNCRLEKSLEELRKRGTVRAG